jgi:hypothetical protein
MYGYCRVLRLRQLVEIVMPGLVPGIHVFKTMRHEERGWPGRLAETRFALLPGHDG